MNIDVLKDLCFSFGVSGKESEVIQTVKKNILPYCTEVKFDKFGNLICSKFIDENLPTILIDAHIDSVGFIVKKVFDRGFISFDAIGGIDKRILPTSEVIIYGKEKIKGVITAKPPHLMSDEEKNKSIEIEDLFIDTGITNGLDQIVSVGDLISYSPALDKMLNSVSGTYLDNRLGAYSVIEIFKSLNNYELPFNLSAVFTLQEEVGMIGSKYVNHSADLCIVIDVTHAKTPDEQSDEAFVSGKGAAIGVGPNINPCYSSLIIDFCKRKNINYQIEVLEGSSGTNAWKYQIKDKGLPCLVLSIPIKFMHTPVETASINDVDNITFMISEFLKTINTDTLKSNSGLVAL